MSDGTKQQDFYETADYYDACDNGENLHHTCEEEALDEWYCSQESEDVRDQKVTVVAYKRKVIPNSFFKNLAERLVYTVAENVQEEFGNPDGDNEAIKDTEKAVQVLTEALKGLDYDVWACEEVGSRTYEGEELQKLVCPEGTDT